MKNTKLKIIPVIGLLLTLWATLYCGAEKKEDQSATLLPLLALSGSAGGGGKAAGEKCFFDSECASNLFCASAYNLHTAYIDNRCTAVPTISGTLNGNGTGLSATITSTSPVADFELTVSAPGKYAFLVTSTSFGSSSFRPVFGIYPESGRNAILEISSNFGNAYQDKSYTFSSAGKYRVRVAQYYVSGSFGGTLRLFVGNTAVATGSGSCTYTSGGKNRCDDYATNHLIQGTSCGTFTSGAYSANSCSIQNAAKTLIGRCNKGIMSSTHGVGMITRHYYDTNTLSDISSDCVTSGVQL
ncbi:hypothetical protein [Leptospira mtsangambouensis]|uniref:hypothetical protein n=1 Tax=Leptospira mtsangambouensis TaxID=2484912 RepID=UPI001EEC7587|nr:hypothetical protein [Leptospira mtsangambouensis]MCG6142418.1 hypothetical protein [Leptospira mtsangambouensis]